MVLRLLGLARLNLSRYLGQRDGSPSHLTRHVFIRARPSFSVKQILKSIKNISSPVYTSPSNPYCGQFNSPVGTPVGTYGGGIDFWQMIIK